MKLRLQRAIALVLVLSLIFSNTLHADINANLSNLNLTLEEESEARSILQLPTQYTLEIMYLLRNLYSKMLEVEKSKGSEVIIQMLQKRKNSENIEFEVEGVGKAEPIVIDLGTYKPLIITKVRHNGLKMSILFIDKNQIDMKTLSEFEKYDKQKQLSYYPPFKNLSAEQIKIEILYQRLLIKKIRTLWAKMLLSEWNPQFEYKPLIENENKENINIENEVNQALQKPLTNIPKPNYTSWVDINSTGNQSLLTIFYDGKSNTILERNEQKRLPKTSFGYWKTYWRSIWEPPSYNKELMNSDSMFKKIRIIATGDYLLGTGLGFALGGLSYLVAALLPESLPHGLEAWQVGSISFGWTLFFGVFSKTWQNFAYRGNSFVRFLKNWAIGMSQSYHYNLMSHQSLSVLNNSDLDLQGIKTHSDILINQSIKSASKTSLIEKFRYRAKNGEADGTVKIPYFKLRAPWKQNAYLEFEVIQNNFDLLKYAKNLVQLFFVDPFKEKNWEKYFRFSIPDIQFSLPWVEKGEWDTHIPSSNFEGQKPQFLTTPVGLLSRFGYTLYGIPLGHILYALLGPFGEIQQTRYKAAYAQAIAEIYGDNHPLTKRVQREALQARQQWQSFSEFKFRKLSSLFSENKEYYEFRIPGSQFVGYYINAVKGLGNAVKNLMTWLSKPESNNEKIINNSIACEGLFN